jgi:DNA polymerase-3 subunit beta
MEFQIQVDELLAGVNLASMALKDSPRHLPILSCVLLRAEKPGRVVVTASDLEVWISDERAAQVIAEGAVAVNAKRLKDMLAVMPEAIAQLHLRKDGRLEVASGSFALRLQTQPASDYPIAPEPKSVAFHAVERSALFDLIEGTSFAMSQDVVRYNLNGAYLLPGLMTTMVATDGHRLSRVERATPSLPVAKKGVIVPARGIQLWREALLQEDGRFALGLNEQHTWLRRGETTTIAALNIDGTYPDYTAVIQDRAKHRLTLPRVRFLSALRRVALIATDGYGSVKLALGQNVLRLSCTNPDAGTTFEDLCVEHTGPALSISVGHGRIEQVLDRMQSGTFWLDLHDETSPITIRPEGVLSDASVIMPDKT